MNAKLIMVAVAAGFLLALLDPIAVPDDVRAIGAVVANLFANLG